MELTQNRTVKILALFLLLASISQPIYTALYLHAPTFDRQFLWGLEALLFVLMAAIAGSALVMAKRYTLGFSAIAFSAVFNVIQVGIGLTQFGPVREAVQSNAEIGGVMSAVFAFSFFGYNAAKILLGLATVVFGMALLGTDNKGLKKTLGGAAILIGLLALVTNALVMMFGTQGFVPRSLAGGSGVAATLLLAFCLFSLKYED